MKLTNIKHPVPQRGPCPTDSLFNAIAHCLQDDDRLVIVVCDSVECTRATRKEYTRLFPDSTKLFFQHCVPGKMWLWIPFAKCHVISYASSDSAAQQINDELSNSSIVHCHGTGTRMINIINCRAAVKHSIQSVSDDQLAEHVLAYNEKLDGGIDCRWSYGNAPVDAAQITFTNGLHSIDYNYE